MKKILIPTDFSLHSEYAAKLASKIARNSDCEIHLLHMIDIPQGPADATSKGASSIPENVLYIKKSKELLEDFKNEFFNENKEVIQSIIFESPSQGILNYTKKTDVDLIIMGSKGHSKADDFLIGSNTKKTVQASEAPVLIIKKDEENLKLKNLVLASCFDKTEENKTLSKLINFVEKFKSTLHLVKIISTSKFENTQLSNQKMEAFAKRHKLTKYSINIQNDNSIGEGVVNFSKEVNSDIIALGSNGRNSFSHILNKSVTKQVTNTALQPVIVFKI